MADIFSRRKRSAVMSRVGHERTAPEQKVAALLDGMGFRYKRNVRTMPGQPDFVLASRRTVIFVHGCFWHRHSNCRRASTPATNKAFWNDKFRKNVKRDRHNARLLRSMGWCVVTVWECCLRDPARVSRQLRRAMGSRTQ